MNPPRNYAAAAAELGVSEAWLMEMTPKVPLPHSKFAVDAEGQPSRRGRGPVVFYTEDIEAIRQMFGVRTVTTEPQETKPRTSGVLSRRRAS